MRRKPPRLALAMLDRALPAAGREALVGARRGGCARRRASRLRSRARAPWLAWTSRRPHAPPSLGRLDGARSGIRSLGRRGALPFGAGALRALGAVADG